jgi:hypothetical protein
VTYRVEPVSERRSMISRIFRRDDATTSVTLYYEDINADRYRENLRIDLSGYEAGKYELQVSIEDANGGGQVTRSSTFEVVKP